VGPRLRVSTETSDFGKIEIELEGGTRSRRKVTVECQFHRLRPSFSFEIERAYGKVLTRSTSQLTASPLRPVRTLMRSSRASSLADALVSSKTDFDRRELKNPVSLYNRV